MTFEMTAIYNNEMFHFRQLEDDKRNGLLRSTFRDSFQCDLFHPRMSVPAGPVFVAGQLHN